MTSLSLASFVKIQYFVTVIPSYEQTLYRYSLHLAHWRCTDPINGACAASVLHNGTHFEVEVLHILHARCCDKEGPGRLNGLQTS